MSERMRKPHTSQFNPSHHLFVTHDEVAYAIPLKIAQRYIIALNKAKALSLDDGISAEQLFAELDRGRGKAATLLKGLRAREDLSQVDFAQRIGVSQSNLSKMENGSRAIGKTIAKRIAEQFDVDYRYFLE